MEHMGRLQTINNKSRLSFALCGAKYMVSRVLNAALQSLPHQMTQQLIRQLKKHEGLSAVHLQTTVSELASDQQAQDNSADLG